MNAGKLVVGSKVIETTLDQGIETTAMESSKVSVNVPNITPMVTVEI